MPAQASLGRMGMRNPFGEYTWKEYLEDMLWSHAEYLQKDLKGSTMQDYIKNQTKYYESQILKGDETDDSVMDILYKWDKNITEEENK